ncbi:MAG: redoxin domain-containing protein [Gammaproteobacteria bacterium]|nr:MAG: redoxin domain-containing protein [Gammaproteobacteria bacterium]
MKGMKRIALLALTACATVGCARGASPGAAPEFSHRAAADWVNSAPLTLAGLRGKVVLVEFWAFECVNCLNSRAWLESVARAKAPAGLVVVGVHTPELPEERSSENVRQAVARLGIRYPVMLDGDYSYWGALHNQYWPAFYLIGRDGRLYGSAIGEMHAGEPPARRVEAAIDQLLQAGAP